MRREGAKVCVVADVRVPGRRHRPGDEADFWYVSHMRDRKDGEIGLGLLPGGSRRESLFDNLIMKRPAARGACRS